MMLKTIDELAQLKIDVEVAVNDCQQHHRVELAELQNNNRVLKSQVQKRISIILSVPHGGFV